MRTTCCRNPWQLPLGEKRVHSLVGKLRSSDSKVQASAAAELWSLAADRRANQALIGQCEGAVPSLVMLLGSSSSEVQKNAAGALRNLAVDCPANQELIRQCELIQCEGAMPSLVALLGNSDSGVQEQAAGALQSLAANCPTNQELIGQCEGAVPGLVALLGSSSSGVQTNAAGALRNLVVDCPANQELLVQCEDAVPSLVGLLKTSRSIGVQHDAADPLRILAAKCPANVELILGCVGGAQGLEALLEGSRGNRVASRAAHAIWSLVAAHPDVQHISQPQGVELQMSSDIIAKAACGCITLPRFYPATLAAAATVLRGAGECCLCCAPKCGPGTALQVGVAAVGGALLVIAEMVKLAPLATLDKDKVGRLIERVQMLEDVLQTLESRLKDNKHGWSEQEARSIETAMVPVEEVLERATWLLKRWAVQDYGSKNDDDELAEVERELSTCYNQLTDVLNATSGDRQGLKVAAAEEVHSQDRRNLQQHVLSNKDGMDQLAECLKHRREAQAEFAKLSAMSAVLAGAVQRFDQRLASIEQQMQEVLRCVGPTPTDKHAQAES